jgi:hypothetical protein
MMAERVRKPTHVPQDGRNSGAGISEQIEERTWVHDANAFVFADL